MANGVEWSLFDGDVGYNSTVLIQGPGQQGLSQTVICKQAGASLIIVTGTSKDRARLEVAKKLGADYVIDVSKEDPLARIMEITGGKGVDVALDCTAGAGTIPILLGIEALKRKAGIIVVQGELAAFPNFPLEKFTVKFITMKSARVPSINPGRPISESAFNARRLIRPLIRRTISVAARGLSLAIHEKMLSRSDSAETRMITFTRRNAGANAR